MNSFSEHVFGLLQRGECVIVPRLGGFVKQYSEAEYDDETGTFCPPLLTVGYNELLKVNDGLLIHSYMKHEGLAYEEASTAVSKQVDTIREKLRLGETVVIDGVGILNEVERTIHFESMFKMEAMPTQILPVLEVLPLKQKAHSKDTLREKPRLVLSEGSRKESTPHPIKEKIINISTQIAVAAVMVVCFLMWMTTELPGTMENDNPTEAVIMKGLTSFDYKKGPVPFKESSSDEEKIVEKSNIVQEPESIDVQEDEVFSKEYYTLVLASAVSKKNADAFVAKMRTAGYSETSVLEGSSMRRVIFSHYESESDARKALKDFRQRNEAFQDAWVMSVK